MVDTESRGPLTDKPRWSHRKKWAVVTLCLAGVTVLVLVALPYFTAGDSRSRPTVSTGAEPTAEPPRRLSLTLMTLNVAHGRRDGAHQLLQSTATIRSNLDEIAGMIRRESPDVVALQEADGPSFWSGNFNHVESLADAAGLCSFVRAEHVKGLKLSYGTALLSHRRLGDTTAYTFAPTPPTLSKGFLLSTLSLSGKPPQALDLVSVHLDFSSHDNRVSQVAEMIAALQERENPLIVMGDFNCGWADQGSPLKTLADALGLVTHEPALSSLATFPSSGRRLDWILVSRGIEITSYTVLPDILSDPLAVMARVTITPKDLKHARQDSNLRPAD